MARLVREPEEALRDLSYTHPLWAVWLGRFLLRRDDLDYPRKKGRVAYPLRTPSGPSSALAWVPEEAPEGVVLHTGERYHLVTLPEPPYASGTYLLAIAASPASYSGKEFSPTHFPPFARVLWADVPVEVEPEASGRP